MARGGARARAGRKAKPLEEHILRGTLQTARHARLLAAAVATSAAVRWYPAAADLEALGGPAAEWLTGLADDYTLDARSGVLALQTAECLHRHDALQALVTAQGALVDGEPHPLIKELRAEQRGFLALLRQLNLQA